MKRSVNRASWPVLMIRYRRNDASLILQSVTAAADSLILVTAAPFAKRTGSMARAKDPVPRRSTCICVFPTKDSSAPSPLTAAKIDADWIKGPPTDPSSDMGSADDGRTAPVSPPRIFLFRNGSREIGTSRPLPGHFALEEAEAP